MTVRERLSVIGEALARITVAQEQLTASARLIRGACPPGNRAVTRAEEAEVAAKIAHQQLRDAQRYLMKLPQDGES